MTLEDACRSILGRAAADAIISDQGLNWAAVAAMAAARNSHDSRALKRLDEHLAECRRANATAFAAGSTKRKGVAL